jgi:hypothetical protein
MGGGLMDTTRQIIELAFIAIAGIYMATCVVAFPIACAVAWRRARRRARDIEYSRAYYLPPRRIGS